MAYDYEHYNPEQNSFYASMKIVVAVIFTVLLFYTCFYLGQCHGKKITEKSIEQEEQQTYHRHDSLTINYTHDGESIRYYVMIDPDTNIQYLVNDRGGMCVREGV